MDTAYFNEIASKYDSWYETPMGKFVDGVETSLAFELFSPEKGMKILDAGCGTGNFSIKLAERGAQVTGIDLSTEMMAVAREKARRRDLNLEFLEMNIYNLAFPDNYFDGVFSMAVFETLLESQKAFRELMRVLKPGRFLMIGTIRKDSAWGRSYEKRIQEDPNTIYRYSVFKSLQEFEDVDRANLIKTGQCLFIPPDAPAEQFNQAEEERLSKTEAGGFMAGLWRKPA
ncbi:MAG: class I SAM-dependent methyltransferase [Syntrophomonadaceae bacterium]|nr:class I SAM-dependent methyltransferase [Syntrophomonadaceae bacterium]